MTDFPRSLAEFEHRFADEAACAEWLLEHRWGGGFACPECGHDRFWRLGRKVLEWQAGYGVVSFGTRDLPWVVE